MAEIETFRWDRPIAEASAPLLALCRRVFDEFDDAYLLGRLAGLSDPDLWIAARAGEWIGFKLGYRRGPELLYSWLGGVDPAARGQGVASLLMERQHAHAAAMGYGHVETRTRAGNSRMIIVNLRHGFEIRGFEVDAKGIPVVIQRKALA